MKQLELKNIHKYFDGKEIIKGVDLTIDKGEIVTFIGPSGGGKSTLLRCINLLETPTSGSIRLGEEKIDFVPGRKVGWPAIQKLRGRLGDVDEVRCRRRPGAGSRPGARRRTRGRTGCSAMPR